MKANQAEGFKPLIDGLAAGEAWEQLGSGGWLPINHEDILCLGHPDDYRKKPEPRRFFVYVSADGNPSGAWTPSQAGRLTHLEGLVEVVEVLK